MHSPALAFTSILSIAILLAGFPNLASAEDSTRGATRATERGKAVHRTPPSKSKPRRPADIQPRRPSTDDGTTIIFQGIKETGQSRCRPPSPNQNVNFDFEGEIQELVETISKITCRNFILTNKVRSQRFKIVSPTPVRARNAWRVFLATLEANDFTVVPTGNYWKIVQANDATRSTVPFYREDESLNLLGEVSRAGDQMVTKLYRIKHGGNINNIVNYLNIFKSNRGQLHPFQGSNLIVMTDYASSLERLERIFAELDQPELLERIHTVPVNFASAEELAQKLTEIFEPQPPNARKSGQTKNTPKVAEKKKKKKSNRPRDDESGGSVSKILADTRTNQLIIIASRDAFRQIMALKHRLDVPEDANDGQIRVVRLRHADAEEMATTLSSLAQGNGTNRARNRVTARVRQNARNGRAPTSTSASLFQGEVKITADKATNSLVITASKSDYSSIQRVIERLDVRRLQVFVEAAILEVQTTQDRRLGVGLHGGLPVSIGGEQQPLIFRSAPDSDELSSLSPLGLLGLSGLTSTFQGPAIEGSAGFAGLASGIPSVGVVLQALQSSNDVNVVSSPHLLTMDNEEAEIQVSEKRPFPSGLSLGLGGLGGLANSAGGDDAAGLGNLSGLGLGQVSFNREDVGLTLKIKPQINDENYVRLEIDQELSDVAGIDQVTEQVITSKRAAKTTVVVRSQDSVIIGGLVRDRETISEVKTPVLGDIPLLGILFKRQVKSAEKVNLVIILTPYIIRGPADFRKIFERKMEERREFVDLFYGRTKEYRAKIDWNQKVGPLSTYNRNMDKELQRAENEGPGLPEETIIKPSGTTEGPSKKRASDTNYNYEEDSLVAPDTIGGQDGG
ncbi:MAG: type II secretion system secretin GspD [Myxococcales bacterium]|nr:type II secretion system secretin GspD [Myxococcales bacterium]